MTLVNLHISLLPTLTSYILWFMTLISLPSGWHVSEIKGWGCVGEWISIPKVALEAPIISNVTTVKWMVCLSSFINIPSKLPHNARVKSS